MTPVARLLRYSTVQGSVSPDKNIIIVLSFQQALFCPAGSSWHGDCCLSHGSFNQGRKRWHRSPERDRRHVEGVIRNVEAGADQRRYYAQVSVQTRGAAEGV